jgi:hypothetical protein
MKDTPKAYLASSSFFQTGNFNSLSEEKLVLIKDIRQKPAPML